jgi:hypothetical protein
MPNRLSEETVNPGSMNQPPRGILVACGRTSPQWVPTRRSALIVTAFLLIVVTLGCGPKSVTTPTSDTNTSSTKTEPNATTPTPSGQGAKEVVVPPGNIQRDPAPLVKFSSIPITVTIPEQLRPADESVTSFDQLGGWDLSHLFIIQRDGKKIIINGDKRTYERWPLGARVDKPDESVVAPMYLANAAPDGRMLLLTEGIDNQPNAKPWRVMGWDSKTRTSAWTMEFAEHYEGRPPHFSISGNGQRVSIAWSGVGDVRGTIPSRPGIRVVLDMATGKVVHKRPTSGEKLERDHGLILSEDGKSAVTVIQSSVRGREQFARLVRWDVENDTETPIVLLEETVNRSATIRLLSVSRDGRLAALLQGRNSLLVIDLETGKIRSRFVTPDILHAVFSSDKRCAAISCVVGRGSGLILVVDLETGKEVLRRHPLGQCLSLDFTPDGRKLFWGGRSICYCEMP